MCRQTLTTHNMYVVTSEHMQNGTKFILFFLYAWPECPDLHKVRADLWNYSHLKHMKHIYCPDLLRSGLIRLDRIQVPGPVWGPGSLMTDIIWHCWHDRCLGPAWGPGLIDDWLIWWRLARTFSQVPGTGIRSRLMSTCMFTNHSVHLNLNLKFLFPLCLPLSVHLNHPVHLNLNL